VQGRGYGTNTAKWSVELADGRRAFVKHALDEPAADWLRLEHHVYRRVHAPYMARLLGWHDSNGSTFLAIEDLSDAHWPPPWTDEQIDAFCAALDEVHQTAPPAGLPEVAELLDALNGWLQIADDPEPFLSLGLCSQEWLEPALPELLRAANAAPLAGNAFLHLDARSDNACFRGAQAILVDWNWASIGNPLLDFVAWLPSLRLDGGPEPWTIVADSDGLSSLFAGFFSANAPLPAPATAPTVRGFQRAQAAVALPWAARELGLPPPTLPP
jgi:aminoglycoside phosphotransferase (APT) family kinase protein